MRGFHWSEESISQTQDEKSLSPCLKQQSPPSSTHDAKRNIKREAIPITKLKLEDIYGRIIFECKDKIKSNKRPVKHVNHVKKTTRLRACIRCRIQKLKVFKASKVSLCMELLIV